MCGSQWRSSDVNASQDMVTDHVSQRFNVFKGADHKTVRDICSSIFIKHCRYLDNTIFFCLKVFPSCFHAN